MTAWEITSLKIQTNFLNLQLFIVIGLFQLFSGVSLTSQLTKNSRSKILKTQMSIIIFS